MLQNRFMTVTDMIHTTNFNHEVIKIILFNHGKPRKRTSLLSYKTIFHAFRFHSPLCLIPDARLPFSKVCTPVCIVSIKIHEKICRAVTVAGICNSVSGGVFFDMPPWWWCRWRISVSVKDKTVNWKQLAVVASKSFQLSWNVSK